MNTQDDPEYIYLKGEEGHWSILVGVEQFVTRFLPDQYQDWGVMLISRAVSGFGLFVAIYLLFYSLTPSKYRRLKRCPKWPGAAFVAGWWVLTTALLPVILSSLGGYDLTYGSLAGVMIALIFFFVIGLGLVIGAELNAALAETPVPSQEEVEAAVKEEEAEEAEQRIEEQVEEEEQ